MKSFIVTALLPLASAHWFMTYPPARNTDDEDKLPMFPCGGVDTPSANRTKWPMNGPIQLNIGHTQYNIEVLLALGADPGSAFNTVLLPTFSERGPNKFCIGSGALQYPSSLNITEGTLGTIQVVTNADGTAGGGLYGCADVIFTETALSSADYSTHCQNSTGVTVQALSGNKNANETTGSGGDSDAGSDGSTSSGTSSAASGSATGAATASSKAWAPQMTGSQWGVAAVGLLAGAMAL